MDSRNQTFFSETHFLELINEGLWADRDKRKNTSSASSADMTQQLISAREDF